MDGMRWRKAVPSSASHVTDLPSFRHESKRAHHDELECYESECKPGRFEILSDLSTMILISRQLTCIPPRSCPPGRQNALIMYTNYELEARLLNPWLYVSSESFRRIVRHNIRTYLSCEDIPNQMYQRSKKFAAFGFSPPRPSSTETTTVT